MRFRLPEGDEVTAWAPGAAASALARPFWPVSMAQSDSWASKVTQIAIRSKKSRFFYASSASGRRLPPLQKPREMTLDNPLAFILAVHETFCAASFDGLYLIAERVLNIQSPPVGSAHVLSRTEARGAALCALRHEQPLFIEVDVFTRTRAGPIGRPDAGAARAAHRGSGDDGRARRERRKKGLPDVDVKNAGGSERPK